MLVQVVEVVVQAEQQIAKIQGDLKRKLIDLRGTGAGQLGPGK